MKTFLRTLPVSLTNTETLERASQLAQTLTDLAVHEEEEKSRKSKAKLISEKLEGEIQRLGKIISRREEPREVDCHEVMVLADSIARVIRDDTGELVETRALLEHEIKDLRQTKLALVPATTKEAK